MFLNNITRRKLSSLLRPWLLSEPELELKLGLINSQAIAKNLRFDTSILNDDTGGLRFNDVTIDQLIIRFSNWSVPAFSFEVHGFHVTLSVRNSKKETNLRRERKGRETFADGIKKKLSQIDPEGSLLHSILEKILATTPSRSKCKTAFLNLILKHCQLQMHDINVQVQFPMLNDSSTCMLHLKELNAESEYLNFGCLLRGLVGTAFLPVKESSFVLSGSGFEIVFKTADQINRVLSSTSVLTCIRLNDFQLLDFDLRVPELNISFSPADLFMYLAFAEISPKESQCARSGRQLWRLAASRVGHVISVPRLTFHNLVVIVGLWLRYVNAYEYILQLVGYSADDLLKRSTTKMSQNKMFLSSVKQHWKVISDIEKELPVESIAQARRIARYRAALSVQSVDLKESNVKTRVKFFCKIFPLLVIIWKLIFKFFHFIVCLLFLRRKLAKEPTSEYLEIVYDDPSPQFGFNLNVGRILVTIFHMNEIQLSEVEKLESRFGIPFSGSFSLLVDRLLLKHREDICEKSLVVSCGQFKVRSSSLVETPLAQHAKGQWEESNSDVESILWFEPAQTFPISETSKTSTVDDGQGGCDPFLENCLGEMWLNWKNDCMQFEESESDIQYFENPCLLVETMSLLTFPGLKNSDSGFWKCFFTLGKFHLTLGCSSILSISLLLKQIQHVLCRATDNGRPKVHSHSPGTIENPPETSWDSRYKCYANNLRLRLLKMLPEKHIQLGVFIAGPCIKLSLEKEFSDGNKDRSHTASLDRFPLAFDIHSIEVAIWPTSTSDSSAYVEHHGCDEAPEPECIRLEEPQIIDIPKSDHAKYMSDRWILLGTYIRINGFTAYLGDSAEKQTSQILVLQPVTLQFSSTREYFDSFSTNVIACSAALCITATGLTVLSYLDEFYVLHQVVVKLSSAVSDLFSSSSLISSVPSENIGQKFTNVENENEEAIGEEEPSICSSTIFLMSGILKIKLVDVSLQKSRINNDAESSNKISDATSRKTLAELDLPDCGILISIQQTNVDISCEEERLEIVTDFSEIHSVVIGSRNQKGNSTDHSVLREFLLRSHNCLYEISFSNFILAVSLFLSQNASSSRSVHNEFDGPASANSTSNMDSFSYTIGSERSSNQSSDRVLKLTSASNVPAVDQDPSNWLFVNIVLGMVYIGSCSLKNALIGAHESNKLLSSLSVGGVFEKITWGIKGGLLFLDTKALELFICSCASYLHSISNILSGVQPFHKVIETAERNVDTTRLDDHYVEGYVHESLHTRSQTRGKHVQALTINVSQLATVLVIEDGKGGVQELVLEFDVHLNFELENTTRKFIFDLKRLSILSRVLQQSSGKKFQIPHFYSVTLNSMSGESGDSISELQHRDMIHPLNDPSCSRDSESPEGLSATNWVPEVFHTSHQKHILKHSGAVLSVQKHVNGQAWVGHGSVSGFDIIISLFEMEMVLSIISSCSGVLSKTTTSDLNKKQRPNNREVFDRSVQPMVPDGSIVAIQDVHQHIYFAVDSEENKYSLGGTIHYSLVGERALFRVKYHQRRWKSSTLWFSLISLHAKNDLGEPFRLNYRPGSGFVDISSTDDGGWASWRIFPCEPESYDSDIDWEPYNQLVKKNFYVVNKKNDCAVAFVDGVPEFVRKPGNPFKFKVFDDLFVARDVGNPDSRPLEVSITSEQNNTSMFEGRTSGQRGKLPCIDIIFDKISLTIVHELSDTSDMFPLLRSSLDNAQLIVQVLSAKTRVISTSRAAIEHFDSQRNSWRELLHPVEIFLFYRSSFHIQGSDANLHGVPVHIHCRTKELNVSLSELSLDILLFVIGKLNLAGPYSLKSSRILANCCKAENQTGVNLLCHFFNKHRTKIATKQSTSMYFRYSDLANQTPENESVSFQLAVPGSLTTSSIHLSLFQAQKLAWRTRIMSSQDSRTYPGPFVVVDVSRDSEDGLSIIVSPLIRIHNETKFSMELRFRRPHQKEDEFATVMLKPGDTIDDSMAMFEALHLSGGVKKALTSLSLGNFLFSFRPDSSEGLINSKSALSVEWSHDIKGGKAVRLSGIFDKLGHKVRSLLNEPVDCSFSTVQCSLKSEGAHIDDIHFLIQSIGRDVPVVQPNNSKEGLENSFSPVTLLEQKEIFLLPTVKVFNLLQSEILVTLSEMDARDNTGNQAMISCGSSADFYVSPSVICFTVTLTPYKSSCKPVNSSDWLKKLQKQKSEVHYLDIDLEFGNGNYFASLRLSRGHKGILEATVFTSYALKNDTDFSLYFFAPNKKPLTRHEVEELGYGIPPELGLLLPPKSTRSWFLKSNKVHLKQLEDNASEALLDLDALSGLTEISLDKEESNGVKYITKLGVSMGPPSSTVVVPSQLVTMVPRYVVVNESEGTISVRQCYLQDDTAGIVTVNSKQRTTLQLWNAMSKRREFNLFETFIRKHGKANDDALAHIQFRPDEPELSWSGPVCITSLGRFFIKFRKQQSGQVTSPEKFAVVHIVEEGSTLVLHYHRPPDINLPYRIENCLHDVSITYYQKDSPEEPEVLGSESSADYVWDDLTLPHKLVVRINDSHSLREINSDKVRGWKPFYKFGQHGGLASHFLSDKKSQMQEPNVELYSMEIVKVGYEVYADGPTRVLRFCEISKSHKRETLHQSCERIEMRVSQLSIQLLEQGKQGGNEGEASLYMPIIAARFGNFCLDMLFTDQQNYCMIILQSLTLEPKWVGAPFAAMLRRHEVDNTESNDCVLRIVCVLLSNSSDVTQVQYSSVALQPIDLNLDQEMLMKLVPFWRTSLSDAKSRQYYFDHFEIQPIKIIANFLPGESYSSYSSAQETLRSLLHSVIKVPPIKNMVVELNGVLVTHALITMRELCLRCAKHYSWYAMRAIYIAKGSPLLPPDFASMFDDLASSSLDAFFDPSRGLINLPGLTLGTFKLISKCVGGKGFSGTKRYFGDLGKSLRTAGSNVLFTAISEISDSVLKGAEASGFNGMVIGFHQGILKLAMEPSLLGSALMEGGPDRKIKLDRSPGVDELYIEGYLQAMLDTLYRQEYLRVRVIDNQVYLKNLPPNNTLIEEIVDHVKGFLVSKALLKGDPSRTTHPLRHLRGESEWKLGPTLLTLCEHLFVSFAIRMLRKQANKFIAGIKWKKDLDGDDQKAITPRVENGPEEEQKVRFVWRWGIGRFVLSGIVAYVDGRLCRCIPNPIARRIVSGFLLTFLDKRSDEQ